MTRIHAPHVEGRFGADASDTLLCAHIAACAERHSHHSTPARGNASRTVRGDALHRPPGDFISMPIGFLEQYQTNVSGTPARTRRFRHIAPAIADAATGSVRRRKCAGRIEPLVEQDRKIHLLLPFLGLTRFARVGAVEEGTGVVLEP